MITYVFPRQNDFRRIGQFLPVEYREKLARLIIATGAFLAVYYVVGRPQTTSGRFFTYKKSSTITVLLHK